MMGRITAAILLVLLVGTGLWLGPERSIPDAQTHIERPAVKIATASTQDLPVFTSGIGRVQATNTVLVKSRVDGPILKVLFTEGDVVTAGDTLYEIDPRPYQATVAQSEGQLARDQAQLAAAKADLERTASLADKGFASHQTYDQRTSQFGQFAAMVKMDQAALDNARLNLGFTKIVAPISGRIGKRLIDAGNLIRASDGTALAEIVQTRPIGVLFAVPQSVLAEIKARQKEGPPTVEAVATEDRRLLASGVLSLIGNQVDAQTGTIELKATFDNADDQLWPGQLVEARLITRLRRGVVAIPESAVAPGPKGRFVYVVENDGKIAFRSVVAGPAANGFTIIESGLAAGERVVVEKHDLLAPGMEIEPEASAVETNPSKAAPTADGKPS
jgi:multidrug efflux system membrane fusion protein